MTSPLPASGSIAGSVLPLRRAEELIATLPGVLSVRIVPSGTGEVDEIHVLTTDQVAPKHTVRNIESALMAQLGMRVNHRKISIATTLDAPRAVDRPSGGVEAVSPPSGLQAVLGGAVSGGVPGGEATPTPASVPMPAYVPPPMPYVPVPTPMGVTPMAVPVAGMPWPMRPVMPPGYGVDAVPPGSVAPVWGQPSVPMPAQGSPSVVPSVPPSGDPPVVPSASPSVGGIAAAAGVPSEGVGVAPAPRTEGDTARRLLLFEDIEVRRSRVHGVSCRVTLSRDGQAYHGEAEGQDTERSRIDLAARATLQAMAAATRRAPGADRGLALEGAKGMEAFDRQFVFVSVLARAGRESVVLTGSCEVRESAETSAVLAVLDATNRWIQFDR